MNHKSVFGLSGQGVGSMARHKARVVAGLERSMDILVLGLVGGFLALTIEDIGLAPSPRLAEWKVPSSPDSGLTSFSFFS